MKLHRYQCDRCGCKYDTNKSFDHSMGEKHRLVGIGLLNVNKTIHRFDLCDDCLDYLQAWLADPASLTYTPPINETEDGIMVLNVTGGDPNE